MATLKQIAERCGVSEQSIRAWCRKNQVRKDVKLGYIIDNATECDIYEHYGVFEKKEESKEETQETKEEQYSEKTFWKLKGKVDLLEQENSFLKELIRQRDEQISNLQRQVDQTQQLHMASIMRLEDKSTDKRWWQFWK